MLKLRSSFSDDDLLPSFGSWHHSPGATSRLALFVSALKRRRVAIGAFVFFCAMCSVKLFYATLYPTKPPLYQEYHAQELLLPHQDTRAPFAGGRKYLWIAGHPAWSGWGNYMQDLIMNAEMTYATGRSYVFEEYIWDPVQGPYSKFNGKPIPSRIPLSAIISGPIVGGPFQDGDTTPRAVTKEYFEEVCPHPTIIDANEVRNIHGPEASADKVIETWVTYLQTIQDPCVKVSQESNSPFDIMMLGTPIVMLPAWPSLSRSPIIQLFGWSTLAHDAFEANRDLFSPAPLIQTYTTAPACLHCIDPYAPLPGLLALHIRRGDYLEHCVNLGLWGSGFTAFNSFPSFLDLWYTPEGNDEERAAVYNRRCVPTIEQIIEKVEAVRSSRAGVGLRNIYIMSNGDLGWLEQLKDALRESWDGWDLIASSRDMTLTPEQKYVAQSTDMLIGQRAQVMIGNGFSSLTSNVAMLRMARGFPPENTRMW